MASLLTGLFLVSAATLIYEVVLTRLLSVVTWYYLAFVSVSLAMFGMTAGALVVQLVPRWFTSDQLRRRLVQASLAMAISIPLALLTMLAVPIDLSFAVQTAYSFVLFSAIVAVPFLFSGIVICLCLTRSPYPIGQVYFVDLIGAAAGCFGALALLKVVDAPSAVLAVSALVFLGGAAFEWHASGPAGARRIVRWALAAVIVAGLNASTLHGIQPIWSKGRIDRRTNLLAEAWNPISRVTAYKPEWNARPYMFGPSRRMPQLKTSWIDLTVDDFAETPLFEYRGDTSKFEFLRYDVTSLAYSLRQGGSAAIIGMGGGRDALTASLNRFHRIVGIEVNPAMVDLVMRKLRWFADLGAMPGLEVHADEGRSFITRSSDKFDVIHASMIDTEAATVAGAMTLSENSLYTVEAWRIFYHRLKPGGLLTFSRWAIPGPQIVEALRLFSTGWATLLSEGVANPGEQIALLSSGEVATLLVTNTPFSADDRAHLRSIAASMDFDILYFPGLAPSMPELAKVTKVSGLDGLSHLRYLSVLDYSPVYDSSPYFFSFVRLTPFSQLTLALKSDVRGSLVALGFLATFFLASVVLLAFAILIPMTRWVGLPTAPDRSLVGGIAYFVAIGLGFMIVEIAMMQQLSLLLGHPTYSLAVVLAGLVFFSGLGSLASGRVSVSSGWIAPAVPIAAALALSAYAVTALPAAHALAAAGLPERGAAALALIAPCGLLMGMCFPLGLRTVRESGHDDALPWMWALNGAASVLASFAAVLLSMETTIAVSAAMGAVCYAVAGFLLLDLSRARHGASPERSSLLTGP